MDNAQQESEAQAAPRARISYACEACRASKVKCQPGNQPGICRRCSESRRECIFKTGRRTRRPRTNRRSSPSSTRSIPRPAPPPPAGPTKTFTIDIPMEDEYADLPGNLESLRLKHEMYVDDLLSAGADEYASYSDYTDEEAGTSSSSHRHAGSTAGASSASHASSLPVGASALSTPPSTVSFSTGRARSKGALASLGVRPQFNLDSAEKLLAEFQGRMLLHFPAVAPPRIPGEDAGPEGQAASFSVPGLAQTKPFVLLAILAAASGSRTLQGHSLYDEEFRKILGLKFVAGGERSMELLQGLVVYTAWYPFHLRPKNRQAFQYLRMVVDIVADLEIDQDPDGDGLPPGKASDERLEQVRTYLATYYLVSSSAQAWHRTSAMHYTDYTTKCCALLERDSSVKGDRVLAWLVRIYHLLQEAIALRKTRGQNEYQTSPMLRGLEAQLAEWEGRMSPELSSTPSIRLALLFAKNFIPTAPLLRISPPKTKKRPAATSTSTSTPDSPPPLDAAAASGDAARLAAVVPDLRAFLDWVLTLPAAELNSFAGAEWGSFILMVILGFRLGFPVPDCPGWDHAWARAEIGFGEYLERFERVGTEGEPGGGGGGGGGGGSMDVLGAVKVVLGVVRKKWERRVARIQARQKATEDAGVARPEEQRHEQQDFGADVPLDVGLGADMDVGLDPMLWDTTVQGCPMMDGSLESYFPLWDERFPAAGAADMGSARPGAGMEGGPPLPASEFADIWDTMTAGWAQWPQADGGFGGGNLPG